MAMTLTLAAGMALTSQQGAGLPTVVTELARAYTPTATPHAQIAVDTTKFASKANSGWAALATGVTYNGAGGSVQIMEMDVTQPIVVGFDSNQVAVSNKAVWTRGSTTGLTAGTYDIFFRYTGTLLSIWMAKDGGAVVQELDDAAVSFTSARALHVALLANANTSGTNGYPSSIEADVDSLEQFALWFETENGIPTEAEGLDMLAGTITPDEAVNGPYWHPDPASGVDLAGNIQVRKCIGVPATGLALSATAGGDTLVDNMVVLKNPETGVPVQYDAGSGSVYWAAYNSKGGGANSVRLATSTDLDTWADDSEVFATAADREVSDLIYMGAEAGSHDPFFLFTSTGSGQEIYLDTSDDMATFTADAANPIFSNAAGPGTGVEDFRVVKIGASNWGAVFEQDGFQTAGAMAIGVAQNTGAVPTGSWTVVNQAAFDTGDTFNVTDTFHANPAVVRDGSTVYVFYEAATFAGGWPETYLRTVPVASFFDNTAYTKKGCVSYQRSSKFFANSATIEGGVPYIYCQFGSGATSGGGDAIKKIAVDFDTVYPEVTP